jgi:uncharacterized damage-inducible protein DinB
MALMSIKQHFERLASYNEWMNAKIFDASQGLPPEEIYDDKGAFFGSVFATLAHLWRADIIWLKRFADHPSAFTSLASVRLMAHPYDWERAPHDNLPELYRSRIALDQAIVALAVEVKEHEYAQQLTYATLSGETYTRPFDELMLHLFNHQTHHRGQITTLFSQIGVDVGATDLLALPTQSKTPPS